MQGPTSNLGSTSDANEYLHPDVMMKLVVVYAIFIYAIFIYAI